MKEIEIKKNEIKFKNKYKIKVINLNLKKIFKE